MTKLTNSDKCDKIIERVTDLKQNKKDRKRKWKNKEKKKKTRKPIINSWRYLLYNNYKIKGWGTRPRKRIMFVILDLFL